VRHSLKTPDLAAKKLDEVTRLTLQVNEGDPIQVVAPPGMSSTEITILARFCPRAGRLKIVISAPFRVRIHRPAFHERV